MKMEEKDIYASMLYAEQYLGYTEEDLTYLRLFISDLYNIIVAKIELNDLFNLEIKNTDFNSLSPYEVELLSFNETKVKENILVSRIFNAITNKIGIKFGEGIKIAFIMQNDYYLNYEQRHNDSNIESVRKRSLR